MMSDDQSYFEQLRAVDPALATGGAGIDDLVALKARVMAQTTSNVVPFVARSGRLRMWRYASAAAVVAIAAGLGYAGGAARQAPSATIASPARVMGLGGGSPNDTMAKAAGTSTGSYVAGYGGGIILQPEASMPNAAGTAQAYAFSADGVDRQALARKVATALGLPPDYIQGQDGSYALPPETHVGSVYVGFDAMTSFNAWSNMRSPWNCGNEAMIAVKLGAVKSSASSADVQAKMREIQQQCDAQWPAPSAADALAEAKAAFASLGLPGASALRLGIDDNSYGAPTRARSVVGTLTVNGSATSLQWSAQVSKDGVFSISGFASTLVRADTYPVVGAKDAAARTALRKWAGLGPVVFHQPVVSSLPALASPNPTTPAVPMHDGKPMLSAGVDTVAVSTATPSLMQVWLADGEPRLMPAWNYPAADGSVWQVLAISDQYVNWTAQPAGGPIAYDTAVGSGWATANSGTATVVAPTPLK